MVADIFSFLIFFRIESSSDDCRQAGPSSILYNLGESCRMMIGYGYVCILYGRVEDAKPLLISKSFVRTRWERDEQVTLIATRSKAQQRKHRVNDSLEGEKTEKGKNEKGMWEEYGDTEAVEEQAFGTEYLGKEVVPGFK